MATVEMLDLRRTDLRSNVLETPYWITSSPVDWETAEDLAAVIFSFPEVKKYFIHQMVCEVTEELAGGTPATTIGIGTMATDAVTTGGDVTTVDLDEYFSNTEVGTAVGIKLPASTVDIGAAHVANALTSATASAEMLIQGAATTVPCIVVYMSSNTSLTAGTLKVHILISDFPGA